MFSYFFPFFAHLFHFSFLLLSLFIYLFYLFISTYYKDMRKIYTYFVRYPGDTWITHLRWKADGKACVSLVFILTSVQLLQITLKMDDWWLGMRINHLEVKSRTNLHGWCRFPAVSAKTISVNRFQVITDNWSFISFFKKFCPKDSGRIIS